jgi:hypothetical protein
MTLNILLTVWAVSIALALLAVAVVIRPLRVLLEDICGTADRAWFWTLYAALLLVIAPLMVVSTPGLLDAAAAAGIGQVLQRTVFYALLGMLVALLVMGYAVWKPVAAMTNRRADQEPQP